MPEIFSIRQALYGAVSEYVLESGYSAIPVVSFVVDCISLMATYREEDTPLFPTLFVTQSKTTLSSLAPGALVHRLGACPLNEKSASKILKSAAPLAKNAWSVYIIAAPNSDLEYGVFQSHRHSLAISADVAMLDTDDPAIRIQQCGHLSVELKNANGSLHRLSLSSTTSSDDDAVVSVAPIVKAAIKELPCDLQPDFSAYLTATITSLIRVCHGTLIIVIDDATDPDQVPDNMVAIDPPIDLFECHCSAKQQQDAQSLANVQAAETLFEGMVNSDGVVVISSKAQIVGYRAFLSPSETELVSITDDGGGRKRTYQLMKLRVANGMYQACFFRSQDGEMMSMEANNG